MQNDAPYVYPNGPSAITSGETWKEYIQSLHSAEFENDYSDNFALIRSEFSKILLVPGFLERFHHSEFSLQRDILEYLNSENCLWSTAVYLELLQNFSLDHREVLQWLTPRSVDSLKDHRVAQDQRPSLKFEILVRRVINHWHLKSNKYGHRVSYRVDFMILLMLAVKHGEDDVSEIIIEWIEHDVSNSFYDFTQIVENWSTLKVYPFEWILSTTQAHQCYTVSKE